MNKWNTALLNFINREIKYNNGYFKDKRLWLLFERGYLVKIGMNKIELFEILKNTSDKYFKIMEISSILKKWLEVCEEEISEFANLLSKNYSDDVLKNNLFTSEMFEAIFDWLFGLINHEVLLGVDLRHEFYEMSHKMSSKMREFYFNDIPSFEEANPLHAHDKNYQKLTKAELRLIKFMLMKDSNNFDDLNKNDVNKYIKRTKEFIAKNYRLDLIHPCVEFINKAWIAKSSLNL